MEWVTFPASVGVFLATRLSRWNSLYLPRV
jgi:hypothetical protein